MRTLVNILLFLLINSSMVASDDTLTLVPFSSFPPTVSPTATQTPTQTPQIVTPSIPVCFQLNDTKSNPCVKICIHHLNVTVLNSTDKNRVINTTKLIDTKKGVGVSGTCPLTPKGMSYKVSNITLKWNQTFEYSLSFSFKLNLAKNNQEINSAMNQWYLSAVVFTNGTDTYSNDTSNNATISATSGSSYFCAKELSVKMPPVNSTANKDTFANLHFTNYTIQAFGFPDTKYKFGATVNCVASPLPSYIPIIVGCALAGLVLLVLLVYIIGRCYKGKQEGYERLS